MFDQANHLRRLVLAGSHGLQVDESSRPQFIVVGGAKGGVGATSVAANLSVSLARDGRRVLLVDADLEGGDTAALLRIDASETIADVLSGRRTVHEAIQPGPAGVQVLAGAWGLRNVADCSAPSQERLIRGLAEMGAFVDFVVLDVGAGLNRVVQRFWAAADQVVLVTTPESLAVMDAYAALKVLAPNDDAVRMHVLVNFAESREAAEVFERLETACRRFLGRTPMFAEALPRDAMFATAIEHRRPAALDFPHAPAVAGLDRLAERLVQHAAGLLRPAVHANGRLAVGA